MSYSRKTAHQRMWECGMTPTQQTKLHQIIDCWCMSQDAVKRHRNSSGKEYDDYMLNTSIGPLYISVCNNGRVFCYFADVELARFEYYGNKPLRVCLTEYDNKALKTSQYYYHNGLLDPISGKISFFFGKITAHEAFDQIRNRLDRVLK